MTRRIVGTEIRLGLDDAPARDPLGVEHSSTVPRSSRAPAQVGTIIEAVGSASERERRRLARRLRVVIFRATAVFLARGSSLPADFLAAPFAPPTWPRATSADFIGRRLAPRPSMPPARAPLPLWRGTESRAWRRCRGNRGMRRGRRGAGRRTDDADAEQVAHQIGRRSAGAPNATTSSRHAARLPFREAPQAWWRSGALFAASSRAARIPTRLRCLAISKSSPRRRRSITSPSCASLRMRGKLRRSGLTVAAGGVHAPSRGNSPARTLITGS